MIKPLLVYGRIAISDAELELLCQITQNAKMYVEIGTLWGGSAITVALNNPHILVTAIDPMIGYYGGADEWAGGLTPSAQTLAANTEKNGVKDRVRLVEEYSHPFPLPGMAFDVGLIDGDHSYGAVYLDWLSLADICSVIAVHDMSDPQVLRAVTELCEGWKVIGKAGELWAFQRI